MVVFFAAAALTVGVPNATHTTMSAADASVSNLATLDDRTKRYLQLSQKKQNLLDQVRELQVELNALKTPLMEQLAANHPAVQICPSKEEEAVYGGLGALTLKLKNDYETLTRDNVIRLLTEFYQYLLPEGDAEELKNLGQGTACWLWNNRKRTPVRYLDRSFVVKPGKRKAEASSAAAAPAAKKKPARPPRFQPSSNMPLCRSEFLALPSLSQMLTSGVHPPLPDQPAAAEEQEDEPPTDASSV